MSKTAYAITILLILGLAGYAWWPTSGPPTSIAVFTGKAPESFTITANGVVQTVGKDSVVIAKGGKTFSFAVDSEKAPRIWGQLSSIQIPNQKVIADVGEALLSSYGIDDSRELAASDGSVRIRWGGTGGQFYIWESTSRRLCAVDQNVSQFLDQSAGLVNKPNVLGTMQQPKRIVIDGLVLVRPEGNWLADTARNRPPFDSRVGALMGMLAQIPVTDLDGVTTFGLPLVGAIEIGAIEGMAMAQPMPMPMPMSTNAQPLRTVTISSDSVGGVVAIQGYPAQRIDPGLLNQLRAILASFARDPLLDLTRSTNPEDILRVEFALNGAEKYRLERRERPQKEGGYRWELVWPGGREAAQDDVLAKLAVGLSSVSVLQPQLDREALKNPPANTMIITFVTDRTDGTQNQYVGVSAGELITATHRGRLDDDGQLLRELAMERLLSDRLTNRDPSRVAKIQRQWHDETTLRQETVTRNETGTWLRTFPRTAAGETAPADGGAIDALIRELAAARSSGQVLLANADPAATTAAKEIAAKPDFELDVRFAAIPTGQASNDDTDLDSSTVQDWGIALRKSGALWECVDRDIGLRFMLDDDTVESLRKPFASGLVFPVVASALTSLDIRKADGSNVRLMRDGARWMVQHTTTTQTGTVTSPVQDADPLAVRRFLRSLAGLSVPEGQRLDSGAPEPVAGEIVASVVCQAPTVSGDPFVKDETQTLALLRTAADGSQPVHVSSNRSASRFPRGRARLNPAAIAEVMAVDAATFAARP